MAFVKFDEKTQIWSSCESAPPFDPSESIGCHLLKTMKLQGSEIAQISDDSGDVFTYEEMRMKTIRVAQNLQKLGYNSKQVFGISARNIAHLAPVVFASFCLGCPINTVDVLAEKKSIMHIFKLSEPSVIFCEAIVYNLIVECLTELGNKADIFTFNGICGNSKPIECLFEETGIEEEFIPVEVDGINDIAAIMCSSGTTGQSKGICISHANLTSQIGDDHGGDQIIFSSSSLYWMSGLYTLLMATMNGATRIITTEPFSPEMQIRIIETHKVTTIAGQSYNLILLMKSGLLAKANLSSIQHVVVGGFKIPLSMLEEFNSYLPNGCVNNGYGLTETACIVSNDFPNYSGKDSVGRIVKGFSIKIIDENGNRCGVNVDGEICIKGRHKFLGYYKNKQLTQEIVDYEGFILTGDIGHVDADGYLYIADRKKDLIFYNRERIFPFEIERVLLKSPEIKAACAVGVPYDQIIELPAAVVARKNGSKMTEADVCKMIEDNLVDHYKLRGGVYFVDTIPTTISGKPFRRFVKDSAIQLYKAKVEYEQENGKTIN